MIIDVIIFRECYIKRVITDIYSNYMQNTIKFNIHFKWFPHSKLLQIVNITKHQERTTVKNSNSYNFHTSNYITIATTPVNKQRDQYIFIGTRSNLQFHNDCSRKDHNCINMRILLIIQWFETELRTVSIKTNNIEMTLECYIVPSRQKWI